MKEILQIAQCLQGICLKELTATEIEIFKVLESVGVAKTDGEEDEIVLVKNKN